MATQCVRTLFNDLVAGTVDQMADGCSKQLFIDSSGTLDASEIGIALLALTALPDTVKKVNLSGNSIAKVPAIEAPNLVFLYLDRNPIASFADLHVPTALRLLDLRSTKVTSFKGAVFPPTLSDVLIYDSSLTSLDGIAGTNVSVLSAAGNAIEMLAKTVLPPSMTHLYLSDNKIQRIFGVSLPSTLAVLNLANNPLQEFEIAAKDVQVLSSLEFFRAQVRQAGCRHAKAIRQQIRNVNVCVLADEEWKALYANTIPDVGNSTSLMGSRASASNHNGDSAINTPLVPNGNRKNTPSEPSPTSSSSSTAYIPFVIGGFVVFLAAIGIALLVRKKCHQQLEATPPTHETAPDKPNKSDDADPEYVELNDHTSVPADVPSNAEQAVEDLLLNDPEIAAVRIPSHVLKQQEVVGRGTYGKVYKGTVHGRTVAIKRLAKAMVSQENGWQILEAFLAEVHLMVRLNHPNLVTLIGVVWDSDSPVNLRLVLEFVDRGDLRQNLVEFERNGRPKVFDQEKVRIARDIAKGLAYLHAQTPKVIHRDLKSRNILLNNQMQAKLSDFGISRRLSEHTLTMTAGAGTNLWMAPEVLMGQRYNEKADMFSFGVVLSEINSHMLPYSDSMSKEVDTFGHRLPEVALLQQVALGSRRVTFTGFSPVFQIVIAIGHACVNLNPECRPSASNVVQQLERVLNHWTES